MAVTSLELLKALALHMFNDEIMDESDRRELEDGYAPSWIWDEYSYGSSEPFETEFGMVRVVETVGGQGQGDHAHIVFQVNGNQHFKIDGYYSSYNGTEWDGSDLREVTPVERTVTFYE